MKTLKELLDEPGDSFPKRSKLKIIQGKILTRTVSWLKAIVLIQRKDKTQLRLCGWQLTKQSEWRLRQKFNISKGYAAKIAEILDAFATGGE